MREGNHENLILQFLVHDDVRKAMENNSSGTALEWGSEVGVRLYEIQRARQVSVERPREATGLAYATPVAIVE